MAQHHDALIYTMVLIAAADNHMSDSELTRMSQMVSQLPVFKDYELADLPAAAQKCSVYLDADDGLEILLEMINDMLPSELHETAYALACDVAAADAVVTEEEMALLEMLRHRIGVDRLAAAAIERGARARHMKL